MSWCPKCKSEYRDGIYECAECKVPLVDELLEEDEEEISEEMRLAMIKAMSQLDADNEECDCQNSVESIKVYQDKDSKAEDFKSSAYTLLFVGIIGLVALVLIEAGVFPIRLASPGKYVTYGVMGGLFIIFIVAGIRSYISSKKYEVEAKSENELTEKIKTWSINTLSKDSIYDKAVLSDEIPEELRYFKCFEVIKTSIEEEFGKQDASYLDAICEELYSKIFEED